MLFRIWNLTWRKATGRTRFELGIFYQDIDDYVFARFVDEESLQSGLLYRYLVYTPADATFTGIDGQISHQFSAEYRLTPCRSEERRVGKEGVRTCRDRWWQ